MDSTKPLKNRDSQNPNGKTAPQIGAPKSSKKLQKAPKSSKMLFGHRNRHKCVVRVLSHERIHVFVKEHQKHVVPLVPLSIVLVEGHRNNEDETRK
jgi:hypothetical protein